MMRERIRGSALAGLFVIALVAGGCATSTRAPDIEKSGFMGADFALLRSGPAGHAQLAYIRPGVNWSAYKFVLLDPVTVWKGKESAGKGISAADEQTLVNYFYSVIRDALEREGFTIVNAPGPDTLRVKVAITKPEESNVTLNVVSTVIPALHAASSLDKLATGKPAFVGEAQVEVKATDAVTGELLAAGIDHRVGGKVLDASMMTSWGDVEAMMRLWAGHGSYNLCRLQNRTSCVAPKPQQ